MKINMCLLRRCVIALFLLALPAVVHAQFTFTTNNGSITITGYTGSGAVVVPAETNGYAVNSIGGFAFAYSASLTSVTIPGSVTNVGDWAFAYCTNLTAAYLEGNAPPDDGTNFYGDPHAVVYYMPGTTGWGPTFGGAPTEETTPASDFEYNVSDGSITILSYNDIHGSAVVIPAEIDGDPVTSLGRGTQLSPGLTSVIIPNTVTNIAASAFQIPLGLTNVTIPGSVLSIGDNAFMDCQSLTNVIIEDGVISIGDSAFAICGSLTSVTIPKSVTNIGVNAFAACGSLARVTILGGSSIGNMAFDGCPKLTSVTLSSNVTSIGQSAFANCSSLTSITIPAGVTNIGDGALSPCTNLTSAYFEGNAPPDDGTIFSSDPDAIVYYEAGTTGWGPTFGGAPTEEITPASEFQYQVYDGSITIIGYSGPGGAVVIPAEINGDPVTGIGIFFGPPGRWFNVTSVIIPDTVTNIGTSAFQDCQTLTTVTIPGSVLSIGDNAFIECSSLTNVIIGDGVTSIGQSAFANCSSLTAVTIPNSVTSIGGDAFIFCSRLASIVIPGSVSSIGAGAFYHCASLTDISVDATNPFYSSLNGVLFDKAQDTLIEYPSGLIGPYAIPNSVTNVGQAFSACSGLTDLVIPASVTSSIGGGAFYACTSLTNISVDSANPLYSSLNGVLLDKAQDTIIDYPPGSSSPYTIPNSVTTIGAESFEYCNLTSVIIPGNVTNIEANAFDSCGGLTNVSIAYGVTSIGTEAFEMCGLTRITIPDSVTSIGVYAFWDNDLTSITIPSSVTSIGDYAFEYCNVISAYFLGNAPPDDGTVFWGSSDSAAVVYYLPGTTGWGPTFGGAPTELWNPQAAAFTRAGNQFGFSISGPTNATVVVEACTNLANPVWLPVSTNILSGGGTSSFSDPQWTNYSKRYYRFSTP